MTYVAIPDGRPQYIEDIWKRQAAQSLGVPVGVLTGPNWLFYNFAQRGESSITVSGTGTRSYQQKLYRLDSNLVAGGFWQVDFAPTLPGPVRVKSVLGTAGEKFWVGWRGKLTTG